ncbi:MAG: CRISPR-associated protein Cas4 [Nanoarchaeota archaeon]|nr:CRISPR-associated protein Cas4 [Nanoarchaeota archaeon]
MLSVTALSGYLYCPRKIYLNYTLGIREPAKPALALGTIRHKVFEDMNNAEEEIVKGIKSPMNPDDVISGYHTKYLSILIENIKKNKKKIESFGIKQQEAFEKMKDSVVKEAKRRAGNTMEFMKKNEIYGEELWAKLTPKMISEFKIESHKLGIRGIIDQVEMYDEYMVPIELKTGKAPEEGAWPSHRLQLTAYMALLGDKQRVVKQGKLIYLDHDKTVEIFNNPFIEDEIRIMVRKTYETLNSRSPPAFTDNIKKCEACGLKEQCHNPDFIHSRVNRVFQG